MNMEKENMKRNVILSETKNLSQDPSRSFRMTEGSILPLRNKGSKKGFDQNPFHPFPYALREGQQGTTEKEGISRMNLGIKGLGLVAIMLLGFFGALDSWAATKTCNGGTLITANRYVAGDPSQDKGGYCASDGSNCNGATFCLSNLDMNWWSSFTWCKSQNRELVSFARACPGTQTSVNDVEGACANLTNIDNTWKTTNLGNESNHRFAIRPNGGVPHYQWRFYGTRALCD